MKTLVVILLIVAAIAGIVYAATKYLKAFKDEDNDGIPGEIEEKFQDVKEDVEDFVEDAKEHLEEVKEDLVEFVEEVKDIPSKLTRKKPGARKKKSAAKTKKETETKSVSKKVEKGDYYKTPRKAKN